MELVNVYSDICTAAVVPVAHAKVVLCVWCRPFTSYYNPANDGLEARVPITLASVEYLDCTFSPGTLALELPIHGEDETHHKSGQ